MRTCIHIQTMYITEQFHTACIKFTTNSGPIPFSKWGEFSLTERTIALSTSNTEKERAAAVHSSASR